MNVVVVFITAPRGKGKEIARKLLEERLAACVNIAQVSSLYWWEGRIEEGEEDLLIVKTREDAVDKLIEFVRRVHPYQVPEVLVLPVSKGIKEYIEWVESEVRV